MEAINGYSVILNAVGNITDDMIKGFKAKEAEFLSEVCDPYMQKYEKEVRLVNIAL